MQQHEVPTIARTYLKFLFRPEYHKELTHETKGQIIEEMRRMGLVAQAMFTVPPELWEEILK